MSRRFGRLFDWIHWRVFSSTICFFSLFAQHTRWASTLKKKNCRPQNDRVSPLFRGLKNKEQKKSRTMTKKCQSSSSSKIVPSLFEGFLIVPCHPFQLSRAPGRAATPLPRYSRRWSCYRLPDGMFGREILKIFPKLGNFRPEFCLCFLLLDEHISFSLYCQWPKL